MSDGHGNCDAYHVDIGGAGDINGVPLNAGKQPVPIDERPKVNGAPIAEQSHEFVIKKTDAQD